MDKGVERSGIKFVQLRGIVTDYQCASLKNKLQAPTQKRRYSEGFKSIFFQLCEKLYKKVISCEHSEVVNILN